MNREGFQQVAPIQFTLAAIPGERDSRRQEVLAVLYAGTRVLGQFTIDRTVSAVPAPA